MHGSQLPLIDASCLVLTSYTGPAEKQRKQVTRKRKQKEAVPEAISSLQMSLDLTVGQAIAKLAKPILSSFSVPKPYRSNKVGVSLGESEGEVEKCDVAIPYEPWGEALVEDKHGHGWSKEGLQFLRIRLFWESLDELTPSNNELEKWDVLKWIFKPIIRKHYVYGQPVIEWHQNDEFFSFHNCCLAVGMDEDVLREGIARNVNPEIINAVIRVCTY